MKIAIFHDNLDLLGGAEKLVLTLARGIEADVITTDIDYELIKKMNFEDVKIISIGKTTKRPILRTLSSIMRFALCNFRKNYDFFVISGSASRFAAKRHKPNLYYFQIKPKLSYETVDWLQRESFIVRSLFKAWAVLQKYLYEYYPDHLQILVANSRNIQLKVKKHLHRDSKIIYPPINCSQYKFQEFGDFWLSVNRIYPQKRIELQTEAFRLIPEERLVIIGSYREVDYHSSQYVEKIKNSLSKNVELRGAVTEKELIDLYSRCKGFISTSKDEDFGMTVVEAMASGKPVVCVREGGYLESIIDGVTGLLVEPKIEDIIQAVRKISKEPQKYRQACEEQAKKFDTTIFVNQMKNTIQSHLVLP